MKMKRDKERYIELVAGLVIAGTVTGVYASDPELFSRLWFLVTSGDIEKLTEFIRSYGVWAIGISFLLDVFINITGFLPSIFYRQRTVCCSVWARGLSSPGWRKQPE